MFQRHCRISLIPLLFSLTSLTADAADGVETMRGRMLYETRCGECHNVSVHGRTIRSARSYPEVRQWVRRWNDTLGSAWRDQDVEEVTRFLNEEYYQYPCTGPAC